MSRASAHIDEEDDDEEDYNDDDDKDDNDDDEEDDNDDDEEDDEDDDDEDDKEKDDDEDDDELDCEIIGDLPSLVENAEQKVQYLRNDALKFRVYIALDKHCIDM